MRTNAFLFAACLSGLASATTPVPGLPLPDAQVAALANEANGETAKRNLEGLGQLLATRPPASIAALGTLQKSEERERADVLVELASLYTAEDELPKAERTFSESLTIYKRLSDATGRTVA